MNALKSFLEDNNGGFSMIRLLCLLWVTALLYMWVKASFHVVGIPDIPSGVSTVTLAFLGAKALQRFGEKDDSAPPPKV